MTYDQALIDWKYLFEGIAAAEDMTGGYVDQEDLDKLLKNPTKKTAKKCLINQIQYWFDIGPCRAFGVESAKYYIINDKAVRDIAERYNRL